MTPDTSPSAPEHSVEKKPFTSPSAEQRGQGFLVAGMGSCYALGTFTDNFYKQCAVLLAASAGLSAMQSIATVLFSLPFIVCSAWAGWIADRLVKKHIVVAAKVTELLALILGGYALVTGWWPGILLTVFLMGLQATAFSPALNGSIPETFAAHQVPRVNSYIKLGSTVAVLAGIAAAGFFLDMKPGSLFTSFANAPDLFGRHASAAFILFVAFLGVLAAFTLQARKPPRTLKDGAFPWSGPQASIRHFLETRKDPLLFMILLAEGFFYGVAAIAVICVANLSAELGFSHTLASLFSACIMIGIAIGAIFAGKYDAWSWRKLLVPAATGLGLGMELVACTPLFSTSPLMGTITIQMGWLGATLLGTGICGGIYLIPIASFIQVRPQDGEKGKILGVSNFFSFVAIALFGVVFYPVSLLPAPWTFAVFGLATVLFALIYLSPTIKRLCNTTLQADASCFRGLWMKALLSLRYRVSERGLDTLGPLHTHNGQPRPILFLPNHPALVDPVIVYSRIAGLAPRTLVDSRQIDGLKKHVATAFDLIPIPDITKDGRKVMQGVFAALDTLAGELNKGHTAMLYPAGRLYRTDFEKLGNNSGVQYLLDAVPNLRVVVVRTTGLWGSSFSHGQGKEPHLVPVFFRNALFLLANLLFFMPRRTVVVEFSEPVDLPRTQGKKALNAWLEAYYNETAHPPVRVQYFCASFSWILR